MYKGVSGYEAATFRSAVAASIQCHEYMCARELRTPSSPIHRALLLGCRR